MCAGGNGTGKCDNEYTEPNPSFIPLDSKGGGFLIRGSPIIISALAIIDHRELNYYPWSQVCQSQWHLGLKNHSKKKNPTR